MEDGYGEKEYPDGSVYKGNFKEGKRDGEGSLFVDEGEWRGTWVEDQEVGEFNLISDGYVVKTVMKGEGNKVGKYSADNERTSKVYIDEDVPGGDICIDKLTNENRISPVKNNDNQ